MRISGAGGGEKNKSYTYVFRTHTIQSNSPCWEGEKNKTYTYIFRTHTIENKSPCWESNNLINEFQGFLFYVRFLSLCIFVLEVIQLKTRLTGVL